MKIYLIDGNSYVYRAYYAIKELTNSKGFPTNAIYGFTNMLLRIIRERTPDAVVVSFDSPAPTERHKRYEQYKAHRPETPGDLLVQVPHIRKMVSAFHIPVFEIPGYEADDILGTIARMAASRDNQVFIVTGDKDMLQMVDEKIKVYDPMKERLLDEAYVKKRYGVEPARIPDFMALTGDAVDNIPGIKGVGEKTARDLLTRFRDIDDLIGHTEKIQREKLRHLVEASTEVVKLSRELATLNTSVPLKIDLDDIAMKEFDWDALLQLFSEYEFRSLLKMVPSNTSRKRTYETVLSKERAAEIAAGITGNFAFDTETTGTDPMTARLVGLAIAPDNERAFYLPVAHIYPGAPGQIPQQDMAEILSHCFADRDLGKAGHNLKFDIMMLRQQGIRVEGPLFDTMIAAYLIDPNKPNHSLEETVLTYLSYRKKNFKEVLQKRASFSEVPLEEAVPYACDDASLSMELKGILFDKLREEDLERLYITVEMPLIGVLADMEETGMKIDVPKLNEFSKELEREIDGIERRIYFLAGEEFNINSPKQLSYVLFESLGFKPGKKTKTGFSTGIGVLEELARENELPREILNYRSLSKLKTTYIDVLPTLVHPETGRIHTSFNQSATATGRLSSSEPNLQNIPIRGEWGKRIREAFIAEPGNILLSADYSQVELRILAHLSEDEGLIDAFRNNLDIHTRTATEIFGIAIEKVTPDLRRIAKTVNFGIIYGISPFGLSATLKIPRDEAKRYIDQYFQRHPGVSRYIEKTIAAAREKGTVSTLFGRKRSIPELRSRNATIRQQGERFATNSPIQGTAADMIKLAMINIAKRLTEERLVAKMVLQVHDELLFELPAGELNKIEELVRHEMETVADLMVPVHVGISQGSNWAEAH
jgi:DNA polymerase-1